VFECEELVGVAHRGDGVDILI